MRKAVSVHTPIAGAFMLAAVFVAFVMASCGSSKNAKVLDEGKLDGNTYCNAYFDFCVHIPEGWYILNRGELERTNAEAAAAIPNKAVKEDMAKIMDMQSIPLLSAYQAEPGSVSDFIPSVQIVAENLKWLPNVKTGEHYLQQALEAFRLSGVGYEDLDVPVTSVKMGGKDFYTIKLSADYGEYKVIQEWYSVVIDGFALNFGFTYDAAKTSVGEEMERVKGSLRFSQKGS